MTAEGLEALKIVLHNALVALCRGNALVYFLQGRCITDPRWYPIMLAPVALANVQGRGHLSAASGEETQEIMRRAQAEGDEINWRVPV
jgi:hypothetical protein